MGLWYIKLAIVQKAASFFANNAGKYNSFYSVLFIVKFGQRPFILNNYQLPHISTVNKVLE